MVSKKTRTPGFILFPIDKRTAALLVAAVIFIVVLGMNTVYRAAIGPVQRTDFTVYQLAGHAVLDEADIYQVHNVRGWAYVYPPPFAILMAPFAFLSVFWGSMIWYGISVALIVWSLLMCVRRVRTVFGFDDHRLVLHVVPVVLLLVWLMSGLVRGQASVLLMWLVLSAFCWQWEGNDLRGGACLAGAILLKVFPLVLLGYFLWRRKWKFLCATFVTIIVMGLLLPDAVFGFKRNVAYWGTWGRTVAGPAIASENRRTQSGLNEQLLDPRKCRNQSLVAVLTRLTNNAFARVATVFIALAMVGAMWLVGRTPGEKSELLVASAVITWMLLVPPVSETHYFIVLLLPLMALLAVAIKDPDDMTRRIGLATLILFCGLVLASAGIRQFEVVGAPCWGTLVVWVALLSVAIRRNGRVGINSEIGARDRT